MSSLGPRKNFFKSKSKKDKNKMASLQRSSSNFGLSEPMCASKTTESVGVGSVAL